MISYNPKDWITFIFRFHKADTFRQLIPLMIFIGFYSAVIAFLEIDYLQLPENSHVKNISLMHGVLGFVISLLLAYRTNTAYDRWWEGRKLWGSLVNTSRNLAIKLNVLIDKKDLQTRNNLHQLISNFPFALKEHLRNNSAKEDIKFNEVLPEQSYSRVGHKPNYIARQLTG